MAIIIPRTFKAANRIYGEIIFMSDEEVSVQDLYESMYDFYKDHDHVKWFLRKKGYSDGSIRVAKHRLTKELDR